MNRDFRLLEDDMLLPVVPYTAIDPETGQVSMDLLLDPDISPPPTGVVFLPDTDIYMTDEDGNPIFHSYTWIPAEETTFGQRNNFLLNVGLIQPLFTGGKIRSQYRMASILEEMAGQGRQKKQSEVLFETEVLFWELYSLQEDLLLAEKAVEFLSRLERDLKNLHEEGMASQNDVLRVSVKLNQANLDQFKAKNGVELASMALCRMTGLPLTEEIKVSAEEDWALQVNSLDELISRARERRPELKMASSAVDMGEQVVNMARARFYPELLFGANYFQANPNPYRGFADSFGGDWNVGVTLRIPIFHWNERRHTLQATQMEKKVQELKLEDARELVELEVTRAYHGYREALRRLSLMQLSLKQAEENLRLARDNFEEGLLTLTELLEAQTLWQDAHAEKIAARGDLRQAFAALEKATGNNSLKNQDL